jgi:hypothetical protein
MSPLHLIIVFGYSNLATYSRLLHILTDESAAVVVSSFGINAAKFLVCTDNTTEETSKLYLLAYIDAVLNFFNIP